jgi:hypothetical protein
MTLRQSFRPLRPELDRFLFAAVGVETDGIPLSVISALARLGLDAWEEASRLSSLSEPEAGEQLARLIAELPDRPRSLGEARKIASGLVTFLPSHGSSSPPRSQTPLRPRYRAAASITSSRLWIAGFVFAAALLVSAILHGGLPFGLGNL